MSAGRTGQLFTRTTCNKVVLFVFYQSVDGYQSHVRELNTERGADFFVLKLLQKKCEGKSERGSLTV